MIAGKCHCGGVSWEFPDDPEYAVACNCSICRRLGAHWIFGTADRVKVTGADNTLTYIWGDGLIAFHTCKTCGTTTHYSSVEEPETGRLAPNLRLADPDKISGIPLRHFDGADTWKFLD